MGVGTKAKKDPSSGTSSDCVNEVVLRGKVSQAPEVRQLPSGDAVCSFRVVVPRPERKGKSGVDALECAVWTARLRRSVERWGEGDLVEVSGALRRRFFRSSAGGAASRYEVEVTAARLVSRAGTS